MTYTQVWDVTSNQISETMVQRDEDGAFIPSDPDNVDYQAYLAWLDEGNEPTPTAPPAPEQAGASVTTTRTTTRTITTG